MTGIQQAVITVSSIAFEPVPTLGAGTPVDRNARLIVLINCGGRPPIAEKSNVEKFAEQ
jgi:hypothetical protein